MTQENAIELVRLPVLDHGYLKLIDHWGSDEQIVEAARMSTNKGFKGWGTDDKPGDEKLLGYLYRNKHSTPFEMAGLTIEVQAPIFVFRQWHRHRTQCLHPDTLVWFERPSNGRPYPMKISEVWRKWQPTQRSERPERQTNSLHPRSQVEGMRLRCLNEETNEFTTTNIVDVIKGEPKPMVTVTTERFSLTATLAHLVYTSTGWRSLGEAIEEGALIAQCGTERNLSPPLSVEYTGLEEWQPVQDWEEYYEVSTHGNVRRFGGRVKKLTRSTTGYFVCSLNRPGCQKLALVHRLVAERFAAGEGEVVRHLDSNSLNNAPSNLAWGSHKDNTKDALRADRFQRLTCLFSRITSVTVADTVETYDIAVRAPWHNFVADGIVVHNSYNEMSSRYTPLPDMNYLPSVERLLVNSKTNKQAGTVKQAEVLTEYKAESFRMMLAEQYKTAEDLYQNALASGVPKELARVHLPVARYSRMRASANLRNWLGFLTLRLDPHAQYEIRVYAEALGKLIAQHYPRTWELFAENKP